LPWRIPEYRQTQSNVRLRELEWQYCRKPNKTLPIILVTCQNYRHQERDIFVWGDSHARHLVAGFSEMFPHHNIYVLFMSGCDPYSGFGGYRNEEVGCVDRNMQAMRFFLEAKPTNIVLASAKRSTPAVISKALYEIVPKLRAAGHNAFVLGDFIRPDLPLNDCFSRPAYLLEDQNLAETCRGNPETVTRELAYNAELSRRSAFVVLPDAVQCPGGNCRFFTKEGRPMFRDHHHLSIYGSIEMMREMRPIIPIYATVGSASPAAPQTMSSPATPATTRYPAATATTPWPAISARTR